MRKLICLLLCLAVALSAAGCGGKTAEQPQTAAPNSSQTGAQPASQSGSKTGTDARPAEQTSDEKAEQGPELVTITIPADMADVDSEEELLAEAEEEGIDSCTLNEDGSVTYVMTKEKHRELLSELKEDIEESLREMLEGDEETPSSFREIKTDDVYSAFDITADAETLTPDESMYLMLLCMEGAYYQACAGVPAEEIDVHARLIDSASGEVLEESSYREWMEFFNELSSDSYWNEPEYEFSEEEFEIDSYYCDNEYDGVDVVLVVTNNSPVAANVYCSVKLFGAAGEELDSVEDRYLIDVLGPGETSCGLVTFGDVEGVQSVSYELRYEEETYFKPIVYALTFETETSEEGAVVTVTNNGEEDAESVEARVLFFDKNDDLVAYDWNFVGDDAMEIPVGETYSAEITPWDLPAFDHVRVFLSGYSKEMNEY